MLGVFLVLSRQQPRLCDVGEVSMNVSQSFHYRDEVRDPTLRANRPAGRSWSGDRETERANEQAKEADAELDVNILTDVEGRENQ